MSGRQGSRHAPRPDGTQHATRDTQHSVRRRGILAAAGAAVAGVAAKASAPVAANDGTWTLPYTGTVATATGGSAFQVTNTATNSDGITVFAKRAGIVAYGDQYSVFGGSAGFTGVGVEGRGGSSYGAGVKGSSSGSSRDETGSGVYGSNTTGGGSAVGVYGKAANGYAVFGEAGTDGYGVTGTSPNSYGVLGTTSGAAPAVFGQNSGAGNGVGGRAIGGAGVQGESASGPAVLGVAQSGVGVQGQAHGVGVYGLSDISYGVLGVTTAGAPYSGITGRADTAGAAAFAGGTSNPNAYAAYFSGRTVVEGDFTVVGGAKNAAVKHSDGSYRLLHCVEAPEPWFEDFGAGALANGAAEIALDPDFAAVVSTEAYHVFLTPKGDSKGLYVAGQTPTGFTVREQGGGTSATPFAWRVVAKRRDLGRAQRLARFVPPQVKIPGLADLPKPPDAATGHVAAKLPGPAAPAPNPAPPPRP